MLHPRPVVTRRHLGKTSLDTKTYLFSFCEEDYAVTFYIAEFVNALTSLAYSKTLLFATD